MELGPIIPFLWLLVYVAIGAALIYLFFWFMEAIVGIALPERGKRIALGIYALIVIIWILTFLSRGSLSLPG